MSRKNLDVMYITSNGTRPSKYAKKLVEIALNCSSLMLEPCIGGINEAKTRVERKGRFPDAIVFVTESGTALRILKGEEKVQHFFSEVADPMWKSARKNIDAHPDDWEWAW